MGGLSELPAGVVVREAVVGDAERLIAHVEWMAVEAPRSLPRLPGEFQVTVEEERLILERSAAADNCLFLVAEMGGEIVGILNYGGGKRKATRHAATMGVSVRLAWQGRGVGRAMILEAIRRAKESGVVRRLELTVYVDNVRAIGLYERCGFAREGVKRAAIWREGEFVDEVAMGLVW